MKNIIAILILTSSLTNIYAQNDTERAQKVRTKSNGPNDRTINIGNNTMPNRISMNVTVGKQTITVLAVEDGAIVLFPNKTGLKIDTQITKAKKRTGL